MTPIYQPHAEKSPCIIRAITLAMVIVAANGTLAQAVEPLPADNDDAALPTPAGTGKAEGLTGGQLPSVDGPRVDSPGVDSPSVQLPGVDTPDIAAPAETSTTATPAAVSAPPADPASPTGSAVITGAAGAGAGASTLMDMVDKQQSQIDAQSKAIAEQAKQIEALKAQYEEANRQRQEQLKQQDALIDNQRRALQSMQSQVDEVSGFDPSTLSEEEVALRSRLETLEQSIQQSQEAASTTFDPTSFPGSIPLHGTTAALRIGGFVKANYVQNFETIGSQDRFIVGTIPTDSTLQGDSEAVLTVSQSRLNFDLRDQIKADVLRAFIEADFAGSGDTFRLRHAFGQWRAFLIGKTWSVLVDLESLPEEIDFEGINGRILARQTQLRFFPKIGRDLNLILSLEDPQPDVSGGQGLSQVPDLVASIRSESPDSRLHYKIAGILRRIEARWDQDSTISNEVTGWGLMLSGNYKLPLWHKNDKVMGQLTYGEGHGRYVNDLGTLGGDSDDLGFDAIFSPNGDLKTIPVFAGYLAYQHWWAATHRSTVITSYVNVSNFDFDADDAYHQTYRATANYIWSPASRIDLGAELLWGQRVDNDGSIGTAWQVQLSGIYRF